MKRIWEWSSSVSPPTALGISLFSFLLALASFLYSWHTRSDPFRFAMAHEKIMSCKSLMREISDVSALLNHTEHDSKDFRAELQQEHEDLRRCWAYEMCILERFAGEAIRTPMTQLYKATSALCYGKLKIQDDQEFAKYRADIKAGYDGTWDVIKDLLGIEESDGASLHLFEY